MATAVKDLELSDVKLPIVVELPEPLLVSCKPLDAAEKKVAVTNLEELKLEGGVADNCMLAYVCSSLALAAARSHETFCIAARVHLVPHVERSSVPRAPLLARRKTILQ